MLKKKIDVYKLHILLSNLIIYIFIVYHVESDWGWIVKWRKNVLINIYSINDVSKEEEKK